MWISHIVSNDGISFLQIYDQMSGVVVSYRLVVVM